MLFFNSFNSFSSNNFDLLSYFFPGGLFSKKCRGIVLALPGCLFPTHSQKQSLSFSPRFCQFECNTTSIRFSKSEVVLHSNCAKHRKIWRTRLRTFLRMVCEYGSWCCFPVFVIIWVVVPWSQQQNSAKTLTFHCTCICHNCRYINSIFEKAPWLFFFVLT